MNISINFLTALQGGGGGQQALHAKTGNLKVLIKVSTLKGFQK